MKPLPHPDLIHLQAAEGWLELGCPDEAGLELNKIKARLHGHPDVQDVKWQLLASSGQWEACIEVASAMIKAVPNRSSGWIRLSYALHEGKLTEDAYDNLLGVVDRFPEETIIPYNLACYSCQLGSLAEAKDWLRQSMKLGVPEKIRETALADEDLKPLWNEIKRLRIGEGL